MKPKLPRTKKIRTVTDSEKTTTKRGRGRPQELTDAITTTIRIERADLEALDAWAREHALSRSQAAAVAFRALTKC